MHERSRSPLDNSDEGETQKPRETQQTDEPSTTATPSDFLTDQQMNEIGAKMIKAEMMGNTSLYEKLKLKLDRAKAFKSTEKASGRTNRESVVLSITNAQGTSRPVTQTEEPKGRQQDRKKRVKRVETHAGGERMQYYPDDASEKYDIKRMVSESSRLFHQFNRISLSVRVRKTYDRFQRPGHRVR
jgi:hypothetical protein